MAVRLFPGEYGTVLYAVLGLNIAAIVMTVGFRAATGYPVCNASVPLVWRLGSYWVLLI